MSKLIKLSLPAMVLLSGCASTDGPMAAGSGKFAVNNFEEQVVDPTPATGAPEMDAAMSAAAIERYRTGKTKTASVEEESDVSFTITPGN